MDGTTGTRKTHRRRGGDGGGLTTRLFAAMTPAAVARVLTLDVAAPGSVHARLRDGHPAAGPARRVVQRRFADLAHLAQEERRAVLLATVWTGAVAVYCGAIVLEFWRARAAPAMALPSPLAMGIVLVGAVSVAAALRIAVLVLSAFRARREIDATERALGIEVGTDEADAPEIPLWLVVAAALVCGVACLYTVERFEVVAAAGMRWGSPATRAQADGFIANAIGLARFVAVIPSGVLALVAVALALRRGR